jgi:hypothetical protein
MARGRFCLAETVRHMSKKKARQEKKRLSLERDRRNTYGENPASSRKNIALGKQRSHQRERHAVDQSLGALVGNPDEAQMVALEGKAKTVGRLERVRSFKKTADTPLGEVIEVKRNRSRGPSV